MKHLEALRRLGPGLTRRQASLLGCIPRHPGVILGTSPDRRALRRLGLVEYNHGTRLWCTTVLGVAVLRAYRLRGWACREGFDS